MRARAPTASLARPALSAAVGARGFPPRRSGRRTCSRSAASGRAHVTVQHRRRQHRRRRQEPSLASSRHPRQVRGPVRGKASNGNARGEHRHGRATGTNGADERQRRNHHAARIAVTRNGGGERSGEPGRESTRPSFLHRGRPDRRGPAPSPPQMVSPSRSPSPTARSSSPPSQSPSPWSLQSARSTLSSSSVRTASIGARTSVAAFDGAGQERQSRRGARRRRRPRDAKADAGVGAVVRVRAK